MIFWVTWPAKWLGRLISWLAWPVDWLARLWSRRRVEKIAQGYGDARYIKAEEWADIHNISENDAEKQLEGGVNAGALEKMYLFRGPIDFVVPRARLDTPVRLSELGVIDDEQDEIFVSKFQTEPVYVATGSARNNPIHAA